MNHIILIHGMPDKEEYFSEGKPSSSNKHWLPWIQKQLAIKGVLSQAPEMPEPYEPSYEKWVEVFEQFKISTETTLVGHSCGGGFLLRYLSEHPDIGPKRVVLVAPWIDPEPSELTSDFFDFSIDPTLTDRTDLHVFYSSDDDIPMIKTAETIEQALPRATYHKYIDKGHFTKGDLGTEAFPELLEELLK